MSRRAGQLLWTRIHATLATGAGAGNIVDTGIWQEVRGFKADSAAEPVMPEVGVAVVPGVSPISRIMVIPLAPHSAWVGVTHGEPFATTDIDGLTTAKVQFANAGEGPVTINVLFWDPHTAVGPGVANTYNAAGG